MDVRLLSEHGPQLPPNLYSLLRDLELSLDLSVSLAKFVFYLTSVCVLRAESALLFHSGLHPCAERRRQLRLPLIQRSHSLFATFYEKV